MSENKNSISAGSLKNKLRRDLGKQETASGKVRAASPAAAVSAGPSGHTGSALQDTQNIKAENPYADMSLEDIMDRFLTPDDKAALKNVQLIQQQITDDTVAEEEMKSDFSSEISDTAEDLSAVSEESDTSEDVPAYTTAHYVPGTDGSDTEDNIPVAAIADEIDNTVAEDTAETPDEEESSASGFNFSELILSDDENGADKDTDSSGTFDIAALLEEDDTDTDVPVTAEAVSDLPIEEAVRSIDEADIAESSSVYDDETADSYAEADGTQETTEETEDSEQEGSEQTKSIKDLFSFFRSKKKSDTANAGDAVPDENGETVSGETDAAADTEYPDESTDGFNDEGSTENAPTKVMPAITAEVVRDAIASGKTLDMDGNGTIDETDVKLMMAFGMDDELEKTTSIDRITEIENEIGKNSIDEKETKKERDAGKAFSAYAAALEKHFEREPHEELTSRQQIKELYDEYSKKYRALLYRLLGVIILLVFSFFYENLSIFGGDLPEGIRMSVFPVVHVMLDFQMVVLASALVYRELGEGISALINLKPIPSSMTALVAVLTFIYDLIACFAKTNNNLRMYGFTVIFCVFLTLLAELYDIRREIQCFNIIATRNPKFVIDSVDNDSAREEIEAFGDSIPENPEIIKISRTGFVDGYFSKIQSGTKTKELLLILAPVTLFAFVAFFIAGLIYTGHFYPALSQGYISALFTMPFSLFIVYAYPFFRAEEEAYSVGSCIIGEDSLKRYSGTNVVSFEDSDVFPTYGVSLKSIKTYGSSRIDLILYYAHSIFRSVGGMLNAAIEKSAQGTGYSEDVEILGITDGGIEAVVDGVHIFFGKAQYLRANGYSLPRGGGDESEDNLNEISLMYIAVEDDVAAKFYVHYPMDPDFVPLVEQLYKSNVRVGIKTFDPNINDQMLSTKIQISKYPVKVIRIKNTSGIPVATERAESGIVSKTSAKALMQALSLCDKVATATKSGTVIKIASVIISLIVSAVIMVLGGSSTVPSFYIALYQLFWIIPVVIITRMNIGKLKN